DGFINRLQSAIFHKLVKLITGYKFKDLGSGVRAFKRRVIEEVQIYGDQHRFFPLLATKYGFKVKEVDVSQSIKDTYQRLYSFGIYFRRILDLLSVFFLVKFTKKPLRFFGLSGFFVFAIGAILSMFLFIQRVFMGVALGDRPIILLAVLLLVLGIQLFSIGLIGEIIIFTHAKELKEYTIDEIIN
ncbi:MAG: dolichol-phosphate mannosyltransferase, partial [Nitrosopumilaceae archaeon]|nr:dolichol-phosphate mannosyltransferase [Nitrosopumilaceae archaeon]NIX62344.1 dolichol-phosphate mannosyltransferase [Nitrosopumilaceae archaeon]